MVRGEGEGRGDDVTYLQRSLNFLLMETLSPISAHTGRLREILSLECLLVTGPITLPETLELPMVRKTGSSALGLVTLPSSASMQSQTRKRKEVTMSDDRREGYHQRRVA